MRVLITGGSGNLARYCVPEFASRGHDVVLFARTPPPRSRNPWATDVPCLIGDLTSVDDCRRAFYDARPEVVLHLGAMTYPTDDPAIREQAARRGLDPPAPGETARVNLVSTFNVATAAVAAGARSVVYGSSTSILHGSDGLLDRVQRLPIDESQQVWPTGSYALSKLLGERILESFAAATDFQAISLRLEWIFFHHDPVGIEMDNPPVGVEVTSRGDALPFEYWQYVDARDAAAACRLAAEDVSPGCAETFFVATDRTTVEPHADLVERFHPRLTGSLTGDDLAVSIGRSRERLGYAPCHSWRVAETAEIA